MENHQGVVKDLFVCKMLPNSVGIYMLAATQHSTHTSDSFLRFLVFLLSASQSSAAVPSLCSKYIVEQKMGSWIGF